MAVDEDERLTIPTDQQAREGTSEEARGGPGLRRFAKPNSFLPHRPPRELAGLRDG